MSTRATDPLQIPPALRDRVEGVAGLRALYRRGSLLRSLGLACLPLCAPLLALLLLSADAHRGVPAWAHVPAGFSDGGAGSGVVLYLLAVPVLAWMGMGLRRVLRNQGVRQFTYAMVFGTAVLWMTASGTDFARRGFTAQEAGQGGPLAYGKLHAVIESAAFAGFSPAWQRYLRAQDAMVAGRDGSDRDALAQALANGQDIGVPVPALWQAALEKAAGLPTSARSTQWHRQQPLRMALFEHGWIISLLGIPALLLAGSGLAALGWHLRRRVAVINGLLLQLQATDASARP